jgi:nicotinate-nucleotide adenylyltransferase
MIKFFTFYISRGYLLFKGKQDSIALFGGSFDPPHIGHKLIVEEALNVLKVNTLIVVPTFLNPFKKRSHFNTSERLEMTKEMFRPFLNVLVSSFEIEEGRATPTAETIAHFQKRHGVDYLIIGADNLASIDKWYNFKWINEQITWVVATRRGYDADTSKLRAFKILEIDEDISSTSIRKKIVEGKNDR